MDSGIGRDARRSDLLTTLPWTTLPWWSLDRLRSRCQAISVESIDGVRDCSSCCGNTVMSSVTSVAHASGDSTRRPPNEVHQETARWLAAQDGPQRAHSWPRASRLSWICPHTKLLPLAGSSRPRCASERRTILRSRPPTSRSRRGGSGTHAPWWIASHSATTDVGEEWLRSERTASVSSQVMIDASVASSTSRTSPRADHDRQSLGSGRRTARMLSTVNEYGAARRSRVSSAPRPSCHPERAQRVGGVNRSSQHTSPAERRAFATATSLADAYSGAGRSHRAGVD